MTKHVTKLCWVATLTCGILPSLLSAQNPTSFPGDQVLKQMFQLSPEQREQLRSVEVPFKIEKEYGDQLFDNFSQQLQQQTIGLSSRSRDARYLSKLIARVKPLMTNAKRYANIQAYVVESDEVDAKSAPGGTLVFYRGLLDIAESEAALIGIVGHELSHLDRRHQLKPLQQQQLAKQQFSKLNQGFNPGAFLEFGKLSMSSFHPFHPEEEAEADQDAVTWMYQLGYDPQELARLFDRLSQQKPAGADMMPAFLRTHPLMKDRTSQVLKTMQQLQAADPSRQLIVGADALRNRIPATLP